jgi:deoxyribose-phosphate aldolase
MTDLTVAAARAIACLDLTNLDDDCDAAAVEALCARADTPHGPVAAVCVWPAFVAQARAALAGSPVEIATVVNFPSGEAKIEATRTETREALAAGATEVDLVVPWRRLLEGQAGAVEASVREIKDVCGPVALKAILETGELREPALIRRAADEAIAGGADFLKTSTGKVPVNATPEAATVLLEAIRVSGLPVGLKASGGVRTTRDAALYLELCDRIMGDGWATPARFRIGASSVLAALLETLDEGAARVSAREG